MVTLAARVGSGAVDHAVVIEGDADEVRLKAMRGGHRNVTTVCGKHGEARGREFDGDSRLACGSCRRRLT